MQPSFAVMVEENYQESIGEFEACLTAWAYTAYLTESHKHPKRRVSYADSNLWLKRTDSLLPAKAGFQGNDVTSEQYYKGKPNINLHDCYP